MGIVRLVISVYNNKTENAVFAALLSVRSFCSPYKLTTHDMILLSCTAICSKQLNAQWMNILSLLIGLKQELMIALQSHILEFTQRLHTVEVERRGLLQEVSKLQEEVERLGPEKEELIEEGGDVAVTQQVSQKMKTVTRLQTPFSTHPHPASL